MHECNNKETRITCTDVIGKVRKLWPKYVVQRVSKNGTCRNAPI